MFSEKAVALLFSHSNVIFILFIIIIVILFVCAFGTSKFWSQFTSFPIVSAEESHRHLGWHEGDTFYFGLAYCFNVFLFCYCELDYPDIGFMHQKHIQILKFG